MIILILGKTGTGKTMLATYLALKLKKPIRANYHIFHPNATFQKIPVPAKNTTLIYDDIYSIPSRFQNVLEFIVANLSRKLDIDLILTAQRNIFITKTLREIAHSVIMCERCLKHENEFIIDTTIVENYEAKTMKFNIPFAVAKVYDTKEIIEPCQLSDFFPFLENNFTKHLIELYALQNRTFYRELLSAYKKSIQKEKQIKICKN